MIFSREVAPKPAKKGRNHSDFKLKINFCLRLSRLRVIRIFYFFCSDLCGMGSNTNERIMVTGIPLSPPGEDKGEGKKMQQKKCDRIR